MASPLDLGLLQVFQVIFPFLFVLTATFAFLSQVKYFKENYVYAAIGAVSLAVLTMFYPVAVKTINLMAPWFVLLFIGLMFILMAYYVLGHSEEGLYEAITKGDNSEAIRLLVFAISLIIIFGSLAVVVSEEQGFTDFTASNTSAMLADGKTESSGFFSVILHPKVLGMAVVLLVAFFAIGGLTKKSEK